MQNNNLNLSGTIAMAKAGLTTGSSAAQYTTTKAVPIVINGVFGVELAVKTNQALPTTDLNTGVTFLTQAKSTGCIYVMGIIAAGTIVATQGSVVALDTATDDWIEGQLSQPPSIPDTMCPFGLIVVKHDSDGADWVFGVGDLADTDIIDTYQDIAFMPDRPQSS